MERIIQGNGVSKIAGDYAVITTKNEYKKDGLPRLSSLNLYVHCRQNIKTLEAVSSSRDEKLVDPDETVTIKG